MESIAWKAKEGDDIYVKTANVLATGKFAGKATIAGKGCLVLEKGALLLDAGKKTKSEGYSYFFWEHIIFLY